VALAEVAAVVLAEALEEELVAHPTHFIQGKMASRMGAKVAMVDPWSEATDMATSPADPARAAAVR